MEGLSERTWKVVRKMFPEAQQEEVGQYLVVECGQNLPFFGNYDPVKLERVRFSVLKLSGGNLDALLRAIELAQRDWRDIFVAAGFGNDPEEHGRWADQYLGEG